MIMLSFCNPKVEKSAAKILKLKIRQIYGKIYELVTQLCIQYSKFVNLIQCARLFIFRKRDFSGLEIKRQMKPFFCKLSFHKLFVHKSDSSRANVDPKGYKKVFNAQIN